jgi:ABC-type xylose transport system substrate-binding protein
VEVTKKVFEQEKEKRNEFINGSSVDNLSELFFATCSITVS